METNWWLKDSRTQCVPHYFSGWPLKLSQRMNATPNGSLNRTLHSMPAFGLAFHAGPNTVLLFRAG